MEGHQININKPVETVYITGMTPLPAVYYYYKGSTEGLVAIPQDSKDMIAQSVFAEIFADLLTVPSDARSSGAEVNVEAIIAAKPDVVFITGGYPESFQALTDAGLTAIAFTTAMTADSNALTNVELWVEQIARVFGDTNKSEALIDEDLKTLADITAVTGKLEDKDKPGAMIIFGLSNNTLTVAGGGHYSDFWLTTTGAINIAAELNKIQPVNIEQVMAWNPDIIYLTNFNAATPDDLYNNTFEGFDWSQVKAVKDRQVYKIPLGSYRWYAPSLEGSLMLKWMATVNQPQLFDDMDLKEEFCSFFSRFYNWNLTDAQYNKMLHQDN
jgi:iron complex transport system substrate-binding protein